MLLDELQQRWQSQGEARLSVKPELLLAGAKDTVRGASLKVPNSEVNTNF